MDLCGGSLLTGSPRALLRWQALGPCQEGQEFEEQEADVLKVSAKEMSQYFHRIPVVLNF